MMHEEKKVAKIVEELNMFFFSLEATKIKSEIERAEKQVIINFEADYSPEFSDKVQYLNQYLNEDKNEGMEDFYWELAGSGDPGETSQLLLIGMMIEKAEIDIKETSVKLRLYKDIL